MFPSSFSFVVDSASPFSIQKVLIYFTSTLAATLIILLGIFLGTELSGYNSENLKKPVNRATCTCDCWDGFFRGTVPRGGYKTFYINYELQTIVIIGLFLFYAELLRHFLLQLIVRRRFALVMLLPSIYSHLYGVWCIMNYLNDHEYRRLLPSQAFFSITELIATYIIFQCLLLNKKETPIPAWSIYLVVTISCIHILLAMGELTIMNMLRNTGLLLPDWISIIWATILLVRDPELRPNIFTIGTWIFVGFFIFVFYFVFTPFRE